jgi:transposase
MEMKDTPRKKYTPEFKQQAVELVRLGKPVSEVAQELNIGDSILYAWVRKSDKPSQLGSGSQRAEGDAAETDELRRLRREIAHLKLENDILKKAAVILGTSPQSRAAK